MYAIVATFSNFPKTNGNPNFKQIYMYSMTNYVGELL
jgi:hypothetical protein